MEQLFSGEMLKNCIAKPEEIEQAKKLGKRIESKDRNAIIEAYVWGEKVYVTKFEVTIGFAIKGL